MDDLFKALTVLAEEKNRTKKERIQKLVTYKAALRGILKPEGIDELLTDLEK